MRICRRKKHFLATYPLSVLYSCQIYSSLHGIRNSEIMKDMKNLKHIISDGKTLSVQVVLMRTLYGMAVC